MGGKPRREHGVGDGDGDGDGSHRGDGRGGNDENIAAAGSGGGDSAGGAAAESRPASSDGAPRLRDTRTDRRRTARCRRPRVDASRHPSAAPSELGLPKQERAVGKDERCPYVYFALQGDCDSVSSDFSHCQIVIGRIDFEVGRAASLAADSVFLASVAQRSTVLPCRRTRDSTTRGPPRETHLTLALEGPLEVIEWLKFRCALDGVA